MPVSRGLYISRRRGAPFLIFAAQDGHPAPARSSPLSPREPPKKNGPRGPARGKGQRRTRSRRGHRHVARGPPPWPPHLVSGPTRCPPRPGRRKHSPVRPLGAPTKTKILTRKPPTHIPNSAKTGQRCFSNESSSPGSYTTTHAARAASTAW
jgi:hypothetical protein